jgi:hypothetical protein
LIADHGVSHVAAVYNHEHGHVHATAIADEHPTDHSEKSHHSGACCGLFCHATAPNEQNTLGCERAAYVVGLPALDHNLSGCEPNQHFRPPNRSLVV